MKKLFKTILSIVLFSLFIVNVDATSNTLKEDSSEYTNDVYIIGTTKFDGSNVITKAMLEEAAENDFALQKLLADYNESQFNASTLDLSVYYFNALDEKWSEVSEDLVSVEVDGEGKATATVDMTSTTKNEELLDSKVEEVENKNIYYVDNEVKKLTYTYTTALNESVSDENISSVNTTNKTGVSYNSETNTFTVDATVLAFTFELTTTTTETVTDDEGNKVEVVTTTTTTNALENAVSLTEEEVEDPVVVKGPEVTIEDPESYSVNKDEEVTFIVKEELNDYEKESANLTRKFYLGENLVELSNKEYVVSFNKEGEYTVIYVITYKDEVITTVTKTFEISIKPEVTVTLAEEYSNSNNNAFKVTVNKANSYNEVTEELTVSKGNTIAAITIAGSPYISGNKVTLSNDLTRNFNLGFTESGTYTITYVLKDGEVEVYKYTKDITVKALPTAIIVANQNYTVEDGGSITVSVVKDLKDYTNATGALTVEGATVNEENGSYKVTFTQGGTYTLTYVLSENEKALTTETKNITVSMKPSVSITKAEVYNDTNTNSYTVKVNKANSYNKEVTEELTVVKESTNATITLAGSEYTSGSNVTLSDNLERNFNFGFAIAGKYTVTYTLKDGETVIYTNTEDIIVKALPTVAINEVTNPIKTLSTNAVNFAVSSSNGDYSGLTYSFTATKGETVLTGELNENAYSVLFTEEGEYTLTYSVKDSANNVLASDTKTVTVVFTDATVTTRAEFETALSNENISTIKFGSNIDAGTTPLFVTKTVEIIGNSKTLSFGQITEAVEGSRSGLVLEGNNTKVSDLTVSMTQVDGWQGNYAIQVYNATGVELKNVTMTNGDAGLLVNGSSVTLNGSITLTDNSFGGIEVSKGSAEGLQKSSLDVTGATITMNNEYITRPLAWVVRDNEETSSFQGTITGLTIKTAYDEGNKHQDLYYSNESIATTFNVDLKDAVDTSKENNEIKEFTDKYYNKFTDGVVINAGDPNYDFNAIYVLIGNVNSSSIDEITINGTAYDNTPHSISIGMNAKLNVPAYTINNNKLYIAVPYLIGEALPGANNTIVANGITFDVTLYNNDVPKLVLNGVVAVSEGATINKIEYAPKEDKEGEYTLTQTTDKGTSYFGLELGTTSGGSLVKEGVFTFRLSSNLTAGVTALESVTGTEYICSNGTCTASENNVTTNVNYAKYIKYISNDTTLTSSDEYKDNVKVAVPGYGVIYLDLTMVGPSAE